MCGYAFTRGYTSNLRLRVPVFVVLCHGGCIIDRGNFLCAGYASNLRLRVSVFGVLWCKLYHGTRKFLMCWLRVYAWLRVKLEVKGTGIRSVLSWRLYH